MSLMTNNGKIITSEDKPILIKGVTLKEVEQLIKDSTITDTNKVIPAQNVSLQTLHDTYGDCFVGRVTYTGFNVLFLFSYNKDEDYYNLTTHYGTQLKAYTHVDMTQDVITLIKHTIPTYSNTYTDEKINELLNNKLNKDAYQELESMIEESRNEIEDRENLVSIIGTATETLAGVMSANDKKNLNTLVALLQNDENNVVDTINEVLAIFEQYPEGANLVELLGGKVDKIDVYTKPEMDSIFEPKKKHISIAGPNMAGYLSELFKKIKSGELTTNDTGAIVNTTYTLRITHTHSQVYVITLVSVTYRNIITAEYNVALDIPDLIWDYTDEPLYADLYLQKINNVDNSGPDDVYSTKKIMFHFMDAKFEEGVYLVNSYYILRKYVYPDGQIGFRVKNVSNVNIIGTNSFYPDTIESFEDIPVTTTSYYDKDTMDNLLLYKADKADTYSKSQIDSFNSEKVDKTTYESKVEELEEQIANAGGMSADTYKQKYQEVLILGSDIIPELPTKMPDKTPAIITFLNELKNTWTDIDTNKINKYGYNRIILLAQYSGTLVKVEIVKESSNDYATRVHSSVYKTNVKECISLNTDKRYKLVNDTYTTIQEPSYFLEEFKIDNAMSLEANHNHIIMNPNVYYIIDSQVDPNLTFTLLDYNPKETSVYREYMGEIRVDETPVSAVIDERIRWNTAEGVTIEDHIINLEAKKTYLFSILNYIGLISSISNPQLDAPVLTLDGSVLSWDAINNAKTYRVYTTDNDLSTLSTTQIDLQNYITNPGIYTVYVEAKDNYYTDNVNSIEYVISTTLATPTNLVINESNTLSWDSVENASSYLVTLKETSSTKTVTTNLCDLTTFTELSTAGTYTFEVNAVGDNKVYLTSSASTTITVTIPEA